MSSEIQQTPTAAAAAELSCTFCDCKLSERLLAVQLYPASGVELPASVPDDGGLTVCPDCASELVELLDAWNEHEKPPVSKEASIGDGYREVAEECSFCGGNCKEVLGVELYRRVGNTLPAYANYTLCGDCQRVFGEFLENLRKQTS